MLRLVFKIFHILILTLLGILLLLCLLIAFLQTKWSKMQIEKRLTLALQGSEFRAKIEGLEGKPPFIWIAKHVDIDLGNQSDLQLLNVECRLDIFSLLKGKIAISSLRIEEGTLSYSLSHEHSLAMGSFFKQKLKIPLIAYPLPKRLTLENFTLERFYLIEEGKPIAFPLGLSGSLKWSQQFPKIFLESKLFSPDSNKTYLEARISGNKRKNFLSASFKIHGDENGFPFSRYIPLNISSKIELNGAWDSWENLSPLDGSIRAQIKPLSDQKWHFLIGDSPIASLLLQRDWRMNTQFSWISKQQLSIKDLHLQSDWIDLKASATVYPSLESSKATMDFSLPDFSLFYAEHLKGKGSGKITFEKGDLQFSALAEDLEWKHFNSFSLNGEIEAKATSSYWKGTGAISSKNLPFPLLATFGIHYLPHTLLAINDFHVRAADGSARGYVYCQLPENLCDGHFAAEIPQLENLFKDQPIEGKLQADLTLFSQERSQDISCALLGKDLRYRETLLDDVSLYAEVEDLFRSPEGRLNLLVEKAYTPGLYLNRLNFWTKSDETQSPFYLDIEGRMESPFECFAKGFWRKDPSLLTVELTRLFGELAQTPFSLQYPSELAWGGDYLNLSPFDFKIGQGHLFSTFELSAIRSLGQWDLSHFPLEIFSCFQPRFSLYGSVSSKGYFDATPTSMEGSLHATLEKASVTHFGKKEPFLAKGVLQANLSQNQLQTHAILYASDSQFLDFSATLPLSYHLYPFDIVLDKTRPVSSELLAEGKIQDLFDFINLGTNHFTGLLSGHLFLSNTLSSPLLRGQLELQKGTYENYFTGMHLRNVSAHFAAQKEELKLLSLEGMDDADGQITAEGKILMKPQEHFPFSFEAEMHRLHAVGFDMIDCNLTGPLYLTGNADKMTAQGNFLVDAAKIHINERLPYEIPSLPVTYIHTPPHLISRITAVESPFEFNMDLELTSDGNVRVEGNGLNAELEGNVHLYGTNTNILANGSLKLIKGEYVFSGKVFKLTEGEVIFTDKPTFTAYLHLNGTLEMPGVTITAMLRGPLASPQLTFQSNPHKPTSSILALILFNKEITEISHPEAIQLASTLVSLSGGAGPDVLESIRKSIGIDRLNIASKPGSDELAVQIGKYLTRGVMITLSQSATSSQVIVEVELPHGFIFQAETQEEEEGKFSLKWRKTY